MTEKILDCRGLSCPKPVLETKEALDGIEPGSDTVLRVIVDNEAAKGNVKRVAESQGCEVEIKEEGEREFRLFIKKGEKFKETPFEVSCDTSPLPTSSAVVFSSDVMGHGDEDLGKTLIDAFCHTLLEIKPLPKSIVCYNRGVYLAVQGSVVLDVLKEFERNGVEILVCGTCLRHYGLEKDLGVGKVSNMFEILEALSKVSKVIHP